MLPEIKDWIEKNTHDSSRKINIYSTSRDSSKIVYDWRNKASNRNILYNLHYICTTMFDYKNCDPRIFRVPVLEKTFLEA